MASATEPIIWTGQRGDYRWLTSTEQHMGTVVQVCPDAILNRYLAVTAIDSGIPWLTDRQRIKGWQVRSGIAYSSRVETVEDLFYQQDGAAIPGFDEWYLFDAPPADLGEIIEGNPFLESYAPGPGRMMVFVGYFAFVIHDPDPAIQPLVEMFWRQLERIRPEAYISDGRDNLTFVCRDRRLFDSVHQRLRNAIG